MPCDFVGEKHQPELSSVMRAKPQSLTLGYRRGWQAGLQALGAALDELPKHVPLTAFDGPVLDAVEALLDQLMLDEDQLKVQPTNVPLAQKYGISLRSVSYWKQRACPFEDGQWAVLDWLADQRVIPNGPKQKFATQLARRKGDGLLAHAQGLLQTAQAAGLS